MPKLVLVVVVSGDELPVHGPGVESLLPGVLETQLLEEPARSALEGQRSPASAYPEHLTEREVQVLRLIAAGRSNQRIADELVISLNTVARHVSNIFCKTRAANRAEAAVFAARHDLL